MRVLVAYGTKRGGTAGIASAVAESLRSAGLEADVGPACDVSDADVSRYDGVLVGGALYAARWHGNASAFVRRNAGTLRARPVWFFSSGPLDDSASTADIPPTRQVRKLIDHIHARGHVTFGGRLSPEARGFPAAALAKKHSGDWRDFERIHEWAGNVASALTTLPAGGATHANPPASAVKHTLQPAAWTLSILSLAAAATASIVTLLWEGAFPNPTPALPTNDILAEARGWSAVTLALVVPMGVAALVTAARGSLRGRLVWAGTMAYCVYTYLEMAVSGPFTPLYLVYVGALACAVPALVWAVASVELQTLPRWFSGRLPRRLTSAFAFVFAAGLGLVWLKGILARTVARDFGWPGPSESIGNVVRALDLGLLVPLGLAASVLLWRRRPSGYVLTALWLVVSVAMGAALAAMVGTRAILARESVRVAAPFAALPLLALALAIPYFRAIRPPDAMGGN